MKPFHKKLIAGSVMLSMMGFALTVITFSMEQEGMLIPKVFLIGFMVGVSYWIIQNYLESKKVKAQRNKEKGRVE